MGVAVRRIEEVVGRELDHPIEGLQETGRGMWSIAYRFTSGERDLVVRVGRHLEDFEADRVAADFGGPLLPIPAVHAIGAIDDEFFCVSDFAPGTPLEFCSGDEWEAVVPSLVDAMEAMRDQRARSKQQPWPTMLLAIDDPHVGTRADGWREKIQQSPRAVDAFEACVTRMSTLKLNGVESTLTHGDLINRNAHVEAGRLAGIFDWGCMRWGDHLYDLAWFEFWSPWHPNLGLGVLRDELARRWAACGFDVEHRADRDRACLTHIGVDHLVYNASIESWSDLDDVVNRMSDLDLI